MRMRPWAPIALASFLLAGSVAGAEVTVPGLANFHRDTPTLSMSQFLLGPVCLSLESSSLDLDCNPAFLARENKHQVRINTAFNDHLVQVNDYRERLNSDDAVQIVNKVLDQHDPVVAQAVAATWYQRDWWALGYVPFRGGFASLVRNPAYPQVSAHIFKESELFAKAGFIASGDKDLEVGFQLRYVDRQFFRREFDLLDALGDPGQLKIDRQKVFYAEPAVSYSFDSAWSSSVSASLTQLPIYQDGYQSPFNPVFDIGFSTSPPFAGRRLRTSTHYNGNTDRADLFSRFRWGAIYDFDDVASVTLGLGKTTASIGVNGHIDSVVLGAGWKTEEISPDQWQSTRVSTVLFEGGLVF